MRGGRRERAKAALWIAAWSLLTLAAAAAAYRGLQIAYLAYRLHGA